MEAENKKEPVIETNERLLVDVQVTSKFFGSQLKFVRFKFGRFKLTGTVIIHVTNLKGAVQSVRKSPAYIEKSEMQLV